MSVLLGQDIFKLLRRRLEESSDSTDTNANWTADEKTDAIAVAVRYLMSNLAKPYLAPLLKKQTLAGGSDVIEFGTSEISNTDDIISILVKRTSSTYPDRFAQIVKIEERAELIDNEYFQATEHSPIAFLIEPTVTGDVKLQIEPTNAEQSISGIIVTYYKEQESIEDTLLTTLLLPNETVNALLYLAEAECWRLDNNPNRAGLAMQLGLGEVEKLNSRYNPDIQ